MANLWRTVSDAQVLETKGKKLDEASARFYAGCVVLAMQHMHSKGIIYRDLKPENLVLDSRGYLKVIDLGCAKQLPVGEKTFTLCGTVDYLCPEMILMQGHGREADLWQVRVWPSNRSLPSQRCTSLRIGLGRGDRNWSLNEGQRPNFRGVCVALYNRVRGKSAGVAKRPRELISHPKSLRYDSQLLHRVCD